LLADMVQGYRDQTPEGWPLHDVLVVAAAVDPAVIITCGAAVEVDTGVGPGRGQTICKLAGAGPYAPAPGEPTDGATQVEVAIDLDVPRFQQLVLTRAAGAD